MKTGIKTKSFPNFYENIKEAVARLKDTVVLYDGIPHYILAITDHKPDGIFRVYCAPSNLNAFPIPDIVFMNGYDIPESSPGSQGTGIDKYLEANKDSPIIRKMMNSPKFGKFRPFPLGMCNLPSYGGAVFLERSPMRPHMQQGLTDSMICSTPLTGTEGVRGRGSRFAPSLRSEELYDCILGSYPKPEECFKALKTQGNSNLSAAFDRNFTFVKGPMNIIFLAYKHDIVGLVPDMSKVLLDNKFSYLVESIQELNTFDSIEVEG